MYCDVPMDDPKLAGWLIVASASAWSMVFERNDDSTDQYVL